MYRVKTEKVVKNVVTEVPVHIEITTNGISCFLQNFISIFFKILK